MSTAGLMWNVTVFFDHGTRGVSEADGLVRAVDRLSADFGAARFAQRTTASGGVAAAFIGRSGKGSRNAKVVFVSGDTVSTSPQTEELVALSTEYTDNTTRLVRRQSPWLGPRTQIEGIIGKDPVILIEGQVDIDFSFAKATPGGTFSWQDTGPTSLLCRVMCAWACAPAAAEPICSAELSSWCEATRRRPALPTMPMLHVLLL